MSTLTLGYQRHKDRSRRQFAAPPSVMVKVWFQRARQRRQLAQLTDRELRDIGVTRVEAQAEAAKAFWQP